MTYSERCQLKAMGHPFKLVIADIDGCLINNEHRVPHLLNGDIKTYHSLWEQDTVIEQGRLIYSMLLNDPETIFLFITGRNEGCREYTKVQIKSALNLDVEEDQLRMRPNGLSGHVCHDAQLKPMLLRQAGFDLHDVFIAVDDRDSVVQAWRDLGIKCWQPQAGPF